MVIKQDPVKQTLLPAPPKASQNLVYNPHPLIASSERCLAAIGYREGESLQQFLQRSPVDIHRPMLVLVNDCVVTREQWQHLVVQENDLVQVRALVHGGEDSDVLTVALTLAVLVAGQQFGPALNEAMGLAAGNVIGGALITLGGMYLVSQLQQAPEPQDAGLSPSPNYAITGTRNRSRPGQPLQLVIGRHRVFPDLGSKPYATSQNGGANQLTQVFNYGLSDLVLSDHKIGDTPVTAYTDYLLFESAANTGFISGRVFGLVDTQAGVALTYNTWSNTLVTSVDTVKITVNLSGRMFYMGNKGPDPLKFTYDIEYRAVGSGSWLKFNAPNMPVTYTNYGRDKPVGISTSMDVASDQYEIRVKYYTLERGQVTTTSGGQNTVFSSVSENDVYTTHQLGIDSILSHQDDPADYTGQKRIGFQIRGSGQLNGFIDAFNSMASARCEAWNGSAWVIQETSNPAWWFRHIAKGVFNGSGLRLYGGGYSDAELDSDTLKAWGAWCDTKGLQCNLVFDTPRSCHSMLSVIARCGRATLSWGSGKLGVVYDQAGQPAVGVFGMVNIRAGSFKINYLSGRLPDEIILRWINPDLGYKQDTVRQVVPGVVSPVNPVTIDLPGITDKDQAGAEVNLIAAEQLYRPRVITWETDLEGLAVQRGDVVQLSHDLTQWGQSGRLLAGTTTDLTLDKKVQFTPSETHYIQIRFPDGALHNRVVNYQAGEADSITLASALPSAPDSDLDNDALDYVWLFQPQATPGKLVKITDIKPLSEHHVRIVATDEDPAYYAAELDTFTWTAPQPSIDLPTISSLKITTQLINTGSGYATRIYATWEASGDYAGAQIWGGFDTEEMALLGKTTEREFSFTGPERGRVDITVTAHNSRGLFGGAAASATLSQIFIGRDQPPADPTGLTITELADGTRQLLPQVPAVPVDFAGFLFRARAGTSWTSWAQLDPASGGLDLHDEPVKSMPWETAQIPAGTYIIAVKMKDIFGNESTAEHLAQYTLGNNPAEIVAAAQAAAEAQAAIDAAAAQAAAEAYADAVAAAEAALAESNAENAIIHTQRVSFYKIAATQPATPGAGAGEFNFGPNTITAPSGWSDTIPSTGTGKIWETFCYFKRTGGQTGVDDGSNSYSAPFFYGELGADVTDYGTTQAQADAAQALAEINAENAIIHRQRVSFYKIAATQPTVPTAGTGEFNFGPNSITAPSGWSDTIPSTGTGKIWETFCYFKRTGGQTGVDDGSNSYATPFFYGELGADVTDYGTTQGQADAAQAAAEANAENAIIHRQRVSFYKIAASQPTVPTAGTGEFNFGPNSITAPSGWSDTIPSTGTGKIWETFCYFQRTGGQTGVDDGSNSYATPFFYGELGADVTDYGTTQAQADAAQALAEINAENAIIHIQRVSFYQLSATQPATPAAGAGEFNFGPNTITAPAGWSAQVPASGSGKVWETFCYFKRTGGQTGVDDGSNSYTTPFMLARKESATLSLFYQTAQNIAPTTPSAGQGAYNFDTKTLTPPTGWGLGPPTSGSGKVWSTVTTYSMEGLDGTVDDGTNTFTTPKSAFELGATNGADWDFDVANRPATADILNSELINDVSVTLTVGAAGDYPSINAAINALTDKFHTYQDGEITAEINLLAGHVITEQITVSGINLGWITITSQDAEVTLDKASMTIINFINPSFEDNPASPQHTPFFCSVSRGGISPQLDITLAWDPANHTGLTLAYAGRDPGSTILLKKNRGVKGCSLGGATAIVYTGASLHAENGEFLRYNGAGAPISVYDGSLANLQDCTFGRLNVRRSQVNAEGATIAKLDQGTGAIIALSGSTVSAENAVIDSNVYSGVGPIVDANNSKIDLDGVTMSTEPGNINYTMFQAQNSGVISANGVTISNTYSGLDAFAVLTGGVINAAGTTGNLSQAANTVSASGIIFK